MLFISVSVVWLFLDRITKAVADQSAPGTLLSDGVQGLFNFVLVHNTGAAWGVLSQSTVALAIFAAIVCTLVIACVVLRRNKALVLEPMAFALIFAGGLGNAIDRIRLGYVVDFINFTFIDFPVFNIADIGVTCGFVLLIIVLVAEKYRHPQNGKGE